MRTALDIAFRPPGEQWQSVSPRLTTARRLMLLLVAVPVALLLLGATAATADEFRGAEVSSGPIDRSLGLTTVKLHTAAVTTDATIPGLPPEVASGLRDRLARRGEARSAGM